MRMRQSVYPARATCSVQASRHVLTSVRRANRRTLPCAARLQSKATGQKLGWGSRRDTEMIACDMAGLARRCLVCTPLARSIPAVCTVHEQVSMVAVFPTFRPSLLIRSGVCGRLWDVLTCVVTHQCCRASWLGRGGLSAVYLVENVIHVGSVYVQTLQTLQTHEYTRAPTHRGRWSLTHTRARPLLFSKAISEQAAVQERALLGVVPRAATYLVKQLVCLVNVGVHSVGVTQCRHGSDERGARLVHILYDEQHTG